MNNVESESKTLVEALSAAHLSELPKPLPATSHETVWLRAIALVTKCNSKRNYIVAHNDGKGGISVVHDFGSVAQIRKVDAIYPFEYLSEDYIPPMRNKRDIATVLSEAGYEEKGYLPLLSNNDEAGNPKSAEQKERDKARVREMIFAVAIKRQLRQQQNFKG